MTLSEALARLPAAPKAAKKAGYRWIAVVGCCTLLTGTERHIAVTIARKYINYNPFHPGFRTAWPSHKTIANEAGCTSRTVHTTLKRLKALGLLAVVAGRGGRTDRYALRIDQLDELKRLGAEIDRKDMKEFPVFGALIPDSERVSVNLKTPENKTEKTGNLRPQDTKDLPTTLSNTPTKNLVRGRGLSTTSPQATGLGPMTPSSTSKDSLYGHHPKEDSRPVSRKGLSKGKESAASIPPFVEAETLKPSSTDHSDLAKLIGDGDVRVGWETLMLLPEGEVDKMAHRLKYDKSSDRAILEQIRDLLAKEAKHGGAAH